MRLEYWGPYSTLYRGLLCYEVWNPAANPDLMCVRIFVEQCWARLSKYACGYLRNVHNFLIFVNIGHICSSKMFWVLNNGSDLKTQARLIYKNNVEYHLYQSIYILCSSCYDNWKSLRPAIRVFNVISYSWQQCHDSSYKNIKKGNSCYHSTHLVMGYQMLCRCSMILCHFSCVNERTWYWRHIHYIYTTGRCRYNAVNFLLILTTDIPYWPNIGFVICLRSCS